MSAKAATRAAPTHRFISRQQLRWPSILLCAITLIALGRVCMHEFVDWDDPLTIAANPALNQFDLSAFTHYWHASAEGLYIPLTYTLWGALSWIAHVQQPDAVGSTLNPWIYHTANLLIHLAATLVVFDILSRLIGNPWAAWIGATVFAIHPVQVETVAWASGTKDLLCGLFIAISIDLLIRFRRNDQTAHLNRIVLSVFAAVLLACLSKPTGIIAPVMLFAIDRLIFHTSIRSSIKILWPAVLLAAVFAVIGKISQPPVMAIVPAWHSRPLIAGDALAFDLFKLLWPAKLCIDYGRTPDYVLALPATKFIWMIPALLAAFVFAMRCRFPIITTGAALAVVGVAPMLGFIPFTFQAYSTVSDHYLYPSMIGVAMIISDLVDRIDAKPAYTVAILLVCVLSALTFRTAGFWADSDQLFSHTLDVNPRSIAAFTNRGAAELRRGDDPAAECDLRQAIALRPSHAFAHLNLASLLLTEHRPREAAAEFREVGQIYATQRNYDPHLASAGGAAFATMMANRGYTADAIDLLKDAIKNDPGNPQLIARLSALQSSQLNPATQPSH